MAMAWTVVAALVTLVIILTYFFVVNARAISRDINARFTGVGRRLENDANSLVADLLRAKEPDERGGTRTR